jgi:hypothetical protein
MQTPPEQVGVPLLVEQARPQAPQWSMRVLVFTSHPVA